MLKMINYDKNNIKYDWFVFNFNADIVFFFWV